jgi:CMP-N,N'-diacetyllegionaminic acid synthase
VVLARAGSVLAVIPARSGSKSLADKNIRLFRGIPLLAHSIIQARACASVGRTIITTDSEEYAAIATQYGAEAPFLRPKELSGDHSTDLEVFGHLLEWLERHEGYRPEICVHLRPTYPLRSAEDIDAVVKILQADPTLDSVRSIAPSNDTPFKMWFRDADGLLTPVVSGASQGAHSMPRQDLPQAFLQNACVDAFRPAVITEHQSMVGNRVFGYVMSHDYDIDDEVDFQASELAASRLAGGPLEAKVFCFDIDGVLASLVADNDYSQSQPLAAGIAMVNQLFDAGHEIVLFTARGSKTGIDWRETTERQMRDWGVRHHRLMLGKPAADYYIDDRAMRPDELTRFTHVPNHQS